MNEQSKMSLMDPAILAKPYAFYDSLRENEPVYLDPLLNMYVVTGYDLLMQVMKDPKRFSNLAPGNIRRGPNYNEKAEQIIKDGGYGRFMPTIVNNDPPGHTVYRALVNNTFRAGRVKQMEDYIREIVRDLIAGFENDGQVDAVEAIAVPVPMYVIADQLGVPRSEFKKFKEWSDAWVANLGLPLPEEELCRAAELIVEMQHYMIDRMHERREKPEDDIMTDLVQSTYNDERPLTDKEVLSIVEQILVAGNETTTNGIANGLLYLAQDLETQQRLRENPDQVPQFVEEILRFESPVQGLTRFVTEDTELGGVQLPRGAVMMIRYAAGNRDQSKFDCAHQFDMDRRNNGAHMAFGSGIHHCVGSQLARAEMREVFLAFLKQFSTFTLACPVEDIRFHPSFALRGPKAIPLALERA